MLRRKFFECLLRYKEDAGSSNSTMTWGKRLLHRLVLIVILSVAGSVLARAQAVSPGSESRLAAAAWADHAPRVDGTLDDPLWMTAPLISDFRQREPLETSPATEKTEVRIIYDARHVYFGIHCYDTVPPAIVATQLRRDLSMDFDDNFSIMIDTSSS